MPRKSARYSASVQPTETQVDTRGHLPIRLRISEPGAEARIVPVRAPLLIGTSDRVEVQLQDPLVSRRHLSVEPSPGGVRVRDESSRNGSWLGRARILDAELSAEDELRIGNTRVRVELDRFATTEQLGQARAQFGRFIGAAPVLQPLYAALERAASSDATILLEGDSGTGKELLAEAIHDASARAAGPLQVVDCAALAESLVESALFGHEKGAFSGADRQHVGAFEAAHGGTIFLDEIGELPLAVQSRLLGVLERRSFCRVGSSQRIEVDVRIVAATNRNLEHEVEQRRFRLDLFHRLAVVLLRVPALSARREDIPRLAEHFLGRSLDPELTARLLGRPWPGNVRELRNHLQRLSVLGETELWPEGAEAPPEVNPGEERWLLEIARCARAGLPFRQARDRALALFSERYAADMLERSGGNATKAAAAAGIARRYFYRVRAGLPD